MAHESGETSGPKYDDIIVGDKTYTWDTNLIPPQKSDRDLVGDESASAIDKEMAKKRLTAAENGLKLYGEYVVRGFGIIPELGAKNAYQQLTGDTVYFCDAALDPTCSAYELEKGIVERLPKGVNPFLSLAREVPELSKTEISELLDAVLAEERFHPALEHYHAHLETIRSRGNIASREFKL